jgi:hydrogenase nickel incorporation protein HypA/HybF
MHELSIVMSILDIATREMQKADAEVVEEIELDIGRLSGVEPDAFDFAWQQAIKGTPLAQAERRINYIPGQARCMECNAEFPIEQYFDPCPVCGEHLLDIKSGKELRVKTILVAGH